MRRDMLVDEGEDEDQSEPSIKAIVKEEEDMDGVVWLDMISPTKRVLSMDVGLCPLGKLEWRLGALTMR